MSFLSYIACQTWYSCHLELKLMFFLWFFSSFFFAAASMNGLKWIDPVLSIRQTDKANDVKWYLSNHLQQTTQQQKLQEKFEATTEASFSRTTCDPSVPLIHSHFSSSCLSGVNGTSVCATRQILSFVYFMEQDNRGWGPNIITGHFVKKGFTPESLILFLSILISLTHFLSLNLFLVNNSRVKHIF